MADPMAQHHSALNAAIQNEMNRKAFKVANDYHQQQQVPGFAPMGITRERSFVRMSNHGHNHQNAAKRRSLAFNHPHQAQQLRGGVGGKPALELYRPPSKLWGFRRFLYYSIYNDFYFIFWNLETIS